MQRVIDISEEDFEIISMRMKNYNRAIDDEVRIMANAIVNGTPLDEVFDKIRAEIKRPLEIERYADTDSAKAQAIALNWCIEIIDKYTKGEGE